MKRDVKVQIVKDVGQTSIKSAIWWHYMDDAVNELVLWTTWCYGSVWANIEYILFHSKWYYFFVKQNQLPYRYIYFIHFVNSYNTKLDLYTMEKHLCDCDILKRKTGPFVYPCKRDQVPIWVIYEQSQLLYPWPFIRYVF